MKSTFENVLATRFTTEGPWKRNLHLRWVRKLEGFPNCSKLTKGALYDANGHIIYDSIRKGGIYGDGVVSVAPIVINPKTECSEVIEGNSAYLGNLYSHYGHFITEGLSRLYDFQKLSRFDNLVFSPFVFDYPKTEIRSYHEYFLEQLGIDQSKVKILYDTAKLEHVTVFRQMWTLNESVDLSLKSLYGYLRLIEPQIACNDGKIFCSRRPSDRASHPDRISNQQPLEELFRSNGFRVIFPEDLSMEEQMGIYKGSNLIVSTSGSTLHNILFGRKNTEYLELGDQRTPEAPHIMQQLANSLAVSDYRFVPFASKDGSSWDLAALQRVVGSL
jgi:hypothetical protein